MENPRTLIELVDNMPSYIEHLRKTDNEECSKTLSFLKDYVKNEVNSLDQDIIEDKKLITQLTDSLYRRFRALGIIDDFTNRYIAIVLHELFWQLNLKGVHIFYILDNTLRDDQFRVLVEQLAPAGFGMITPHIIDGLEYTQTNTETDNYSYEEIEEKMNGWIKESYCKNIIYIERDTSINYLDKVAKFAKGLGDDYAKVYRNEGYESLSINNLDQI